jgi:hypothetical protein
MLEATLQDLKTKPANTPAIPENISNLTDTSGNPIAGDATGYNDGSLAAQPQLAKASASVLSYLFGTSAPATPKPKPARKVK